MTQKGVIELENGFMIEIKRNNLITFRIFTGLMLDLKALINLSHAYRVTGTAKYIHVCQQNKVATMSKHNSKKREGTD